MKKVKAIAREPNSDLLLKLIDPLYDRKMMEWEPGYFAPEELADSY
jgi:hypothetical protein